MDRSKISRIVKKELSEQTLGVVQQFLEVHEIEFKNKKPTLLKVQLDENNKILVYLAVKDERFYFVLVIDTKSEQPISAYCENYVSLQLTAISSTISAKKMQDLTKIKFPIVVKKGQRRRPQAKKLTQNQISLKIKTTPDSFESTIENLITFLEKDSSGIRNLSNNSSMYLSICIVFHNGNGMLGGFNLSPKLIERISAFNINLDFDLYACGQKFL